VLVLILGSVGCKLVYWCDAVLLLAVKARLAVSQAGCDRLFHKQRLPDVLLLLRSLKPSHEQ
jgi:hypothetical protein